MLINFILRLSMYTQLSLICEFKLVYGRQLANSGESKSVREHPTNS